ncbi:MAG: crossover junction endodeoxyribonuclease RuvC [Pseudomonadota bacterium]
MSRRVRILGIDPGSRLTGFGVVELVSDKARFIASGSVRTSDGEFPDRLRQIFDAVASLVVEYEPHELAIESVFVHKNAGSALKLGHARAAALCATFSGNLSVHEYAPREIKQAVTGTGNASKEQVQHMVVALLGLDGTPSADAADALAAALCHGHRRQIDSRVGDVLSLGGSR